MIESKDEWQQYLKVLKGHTAGALLFKDCHMNEFGSACKLMREWVSAIYL